MEKHIRKSHNKTMLLYHLVCPVRYRTEIITKDVEKTLEIVCKEIEKRYEIEFIEIGVDKNHVHFMIQSIPTESPTNLVKKIKSIAGREMFLRHPEIKKKLWGAKFWTSGYYINTVGQYGNAEVIKKYVKNQGMEYNKIYKG